jgi:hypothetical protein
VHVVKSSLHPIFLYRAKKYTDLRNELMYTINYQVTIDLKLLLKGSDTLSVDQNIDIYTIILSCISSVLLIFYLSVLLFHCLLLFFF